MKLLPAPKEPSNFFDKYYYGIDFGFGPSQSRRSIQAFFNLSPEDVDNALLSESIFIHDVLYEVPYQQLTVIKRNMDCGLSYNRVYLTLVEKL